MNSDSFLQNSFSGRNLDDLSEGIQMLREYMFFNNFNFLRLCQSYDKLDSGLTGFSCFFENLGKLSIEKFEQGLLNAPFRFTEKHLRDIINDAPKNRRGEILYRDLHFVLSKGMKPKTRISTKYITGTKPSIITEDLTEEEANLESALAQFFKKKQIYELEHYDLDHLDIKLIKNKNTAEGSPSEIAIQNIYAHNNIGIIENFQILVSQELYTKLFPIQVEVKDAQLRSAFLQYIKKREEDFYTPLHEIEFIRVIQMFGMKLSVDECNLLYLLIFRSFAENTVNLASVMDWMKSQKGRRPKSLIHMTDFVGDLQKKIEKKIEMPEIFTSLVKVIAEIGFIKFESSIDFITTKNQIEVEKFLRLVKQYEIRTGSEEINKLKIYLAQEGVLDLTNKESIHESQIVINQERLLLLVRKICQDLFIPVTALKEKASSLEDAILKFHMGIYNSYWRQIQERLDGFCDSFRMITETKLKEILKSMIYGIDNFTLDKIIDSLKYNQNISKDSLQRKIFVDEFMAKLQNDKPESIENVKKIIEAVQQKVEPIQETKNIIEGRIEYSGLPDTKIRTTDLDAGQVLGKLHNVLKELLNSQIINVSPQEEGISTLPLLKILKSYDKNNNGLIEAKLFRQIIIECFPIFSLPEVIILTEMASKISSSEDKRLEQKTEKSAIGANLISYYHFLMQIEKYYALKESTSKTP